MKIATSIILASSLAASAGEIHKGMTKNQVRHEFGSPYNIQALNSGEEWTIAENPMKMWIPLHQLRQITVDFNRSGRVTSYSVTE
jgi:outer membrane protein assembly factor BamE (lipoprotein component of BamABCDE complex)